MKKFFDIVVLLAAYNGEQYIGEQLDSILKQEGVNLSIIISLDKSDDSTLSIINNYIRKYPSSIKVLSYGDSYGSAGQNFVRLLSEVDFSTYQYVSFADQDDIWHPEKLKHAIHNIDDKGIDGYSSNVTAFWCSGVTKLVKKDYKQTEFDYLFESPGPGCTFVLTQSLAVSIQSHLHSKKGALKELWLHDWYCYSYARYNGFRWYIDSTPLMQYRQHDSNEIGANSGWMGFKSRLSVIMSGKGFSKVMAQADFIDQLNCIPILLIARKKRFAMLKLFLISWKCRRQLSHKMMLSFACLFFFIKGYSNNGEK